MSLKYGDRPRKAFEYIMSHRDEGPGAVAERFDIPANALHSYMTIQRRKGVDVPKFQRKGRTLLAAKRNKPTISQFILEEPERIKTAETSDGEVSVFIMKGSASSIERVAQSIARFVGGN